MAFEGNASGSGGFDPPGRYFVQRAAAASEPGPEPTPSLLPEDSDDDSLSDHGNQASTDPPRAASGPGVVVASESYVSSLPSPGPSPGSWATVGDMSTGSEMVNQLSRLRPDTRDRIVQLCTRMGSPPLPKAPKSSFPPARPASAVPKADARLVQTDDLGFSLPAVPDPTEPTAVAKTPSFRAARPTVVHPPPCLVQCPTPGCFNQCGRPVYGRGHRNHFCRVCHRLHR